MLRKNLIPEQAVSFHDSWFIAERHLTLWKGCEKPHVEGWSHSRSAGKGGLEGEERRQLVQKLTHIMATLHDDIRRIQLAHAQ